MEQDNTHLLRDTRCYLCGAIENEEDPNNWRNIIEKGLYDLNMIVYNPLKKPLRWMPPIDGKRQREMRSQLSSPETLYENHLARKFCLNLVRHSNILIVKLMKKFTVGTFEEINLAIGKPIFIISDSIDSMWLIDQLNLYNYDRRKIYFCANIDECLNRLRQIDNGTLKVDPMEWIFLDENYRHKGENNV